MLMNAHSRSIAIDAAPDGVHAYVADATRLPDWAPAFATSVRPAGDDRWVVSQGDSELEIAVVADPASRTADFVAHVNRDVGAFTRVIPNGDGCEFTLTLLFPEGAGPDVVDAHMADVEAELAAVRAACEAA